MPIIARDWVIATSAAPAVGPCGEVVPCCADTTNTGKIAELAAPALQVGQHSIG